MIPIKCTICDNEFTREDFQPGPSLSVEYPVYMKNIRMTSDGFTHITCFRTRIEESDEEHT